MGHVFEQLAELVTRWAGGNGGFFTAMAVVLVWAVLGPVFGFSDTWQLVINTGTTIVTFLMVFLIQRTQNKESLALHLKLNELVAAIERGEQPAHRRGGARPRTSCRSCASTTTSSRL